MMTLVANEKEAQIVEEIEAEAEIDRETADTNPVDGIAVTTGRILASEIEAEAASTTGDIAEAETAKNLEARVVASEKKLMRTGRKNMCMIRRRKKKEWRCLRSRRCRW